MLFRHEVGSADDQADRPETTWSETLSTITGMIGDAFLGSGISFSYDRPKSCFSIETDNYKAKLEHEKGRYFRIRTKQKKPTGHTTRPYKHERLRKSQRARVRTPSNESSKSMHSKGRCKQRAKSRIEKWCVCKKGFMIGTAR